MYGTWIHSVWGPQLWGSKHSVGRVPSDRTMFQLPQRHYLGQKRTKTVRDSSMPPPPQQKTQCSQPAQQPEVTAALTLQQLAQPPSSKIQYPLEELLERSHMGLNVEQQQFKGLLRGFTDVFATKDDHCWHTNLVLHDINSRYACPIQLHDRRLPLTKH